MSERSATRAQDMRALLRLVAHLDRYVAEAEVHDGLERWRVFFRDEIETVQRARNNIVWCSWISDSNLRAAVGIAGRLADLAVEVETRPAARAVTP